MTAPETPVEVTVLDGAMHSVWLHGDWRWLTRNMTTEQREAAWAAVKRYSQAQAPDEEPLSDDWAWWREDAHPERVWLDWHTRR